MSTLFMRVLYFLCKLAMSKMMAGNIAFPSLILCFSFADPSLFLRTKLDDPSLLHRLCTDFAPTLVRRKSEGTANLHGRYFEEKS